MSVFRAVAILIGVLAAPQALAASFVSLGDAPVATSRSIITLGEPSSFVALGAPADDPAKPDRSIETAALPDHGQSPQQAVAAQFGQLAPPEPDETRETDSRYVVAWPPPLSRSMVAFGTPAPQTEQPVIQMAARAPFSLPTVFRGGLIGEAFKTTPSPARAATEETPVEETAPAEPASAQPDQQPSQPAAVAERRDTPPDPSPRDRTPMPPALPTVAPTPPPSMRLE